MAVSTDYFNTIKELQAAISTLESKMQQAAENLEFELAAVLRDQLNALKDQMK